MRRFITFIISGLLITISVWHFTTLTTSFEWLLTTNDTFDYLRYAVAAAFLGYALLPKKRAIQTLVHSLGFLSLIVGATAIMFHGFYQSLGFYFYPLEAVMFLEAGIVGTLTGMHHYGVLLPRIKPRAKYVYSRLRSVLKHSQNSVKKPRQITVKYLSHSHGTNNS